MVWPVPDADVVSLPRTFRDAVRAEFGRALRPPYATLSTVALGISARAGILCPYHPMPLRVRWEHRRPPGRMLWRWLTLAVTPYVLVPWLAVALMTPFGVVSLIAGIVVVSAPTSSLNVLDVLLGIWFIVMGIFEISGGFILRHELRATPKVHA